MHDAQVVPFRILIVDDDATNRLVLADALDRPEYQLAFAVDGAAALGAVEQEPPDLVLLDVMMPGIGGVEVCERLRQQSAYRDIAVIMITALADRDSRLAGLAAGADDFLRKPIDILDLQLRVASQAKTRRYRALLEERQRFDALADLSPDPMFVATPGGAVLHCNSAARALSLETAGPEAPQTLNAMMPADAEGARWLARPMATHLGVTQTVVATSPHGAVEFEIACRQANWRGQPAFILAARDVTDLNRLRRAAQQRQRHDAIARATVGIAHDFRNYLTAIQAGADLLAIEIPHTATAARQTVTEIAAQIEVGLGFIERLLALAKGRDASPVIVDLNELITSSHTLIEQWASPGVLDIETSSGAALVKASRDQLMQILSNLLVNAGQAVEAGGSVTVRTHLASFPDSSDGSPGRTVVLTIVDTGKGMDASTQARIFEPYFTTKGDDGGTGIGLSTVHDLMRLSGGDIRVKSAPGEGTSVILSWPAADSANAADAVR